MPAAGEIFLGVYPHLPLGKRNKNVIFERFRKSKCAAGEKKLTFLMYNARKSMIFGPPQAEIFGVYKNAPPICPKHFQGGAFLSGIALMVCFFSSIASNLWI